MNSQQAVLKDMFFCLSPEYRLHIRPDGGNVYPLPKPGDPTLACSTFNLNTTATKIIEQCNGRNTTTDILEALSGDAEFPRDPKAYIGDIMDCLIDSCENGFLQFHSSAQRHEVSITGSYGQYTPRHLVVELTDQCNLICKHCYRNSSPGRRNQLAGDVLIKILAEFVAQGLVTVELTGGEATVHPEFPKILEYCCSVFQKTALLTNGFEIEDQCFDIMRKYKERVAVQVDVDGITAASHDWLRGVSGSYTNAIKSIKSFVKNDIPCRVSMNVHAGNLYEIEDVLKLAKKLGANWFAFTIVLPLGRGRSMAGFSTDELAYLADLTEKFKLSYPDFFFHLKESQMESFNNPSKNCGAGWSSLTLGPTGKLRPCPMFDERHFSLGDLTRMSLSEVLDSSLSEFRTLTEMATPGDGACAGCSNAALCRGCIARPVTINRGHLNDCNWAQRTGMNRLLEAVKTDT